MCVRGTELVAPARSNRVIAGEYARLASLKQHLAAIAIMFDFVRSSACLLAADRPGTQAGAMPVVPLASRRAGPSIWARESPLLAASRGLMGVA